MSEQDSAEIRRQISQLDIKADPTRKLSLIYVAALLFIAFLAASIFSLNDRMLTEQERISHVVIQTSHLSYLTQDALLEARRVLAGEEADARTELGKTLERLSDRHRVMIDDDIAKRADRTAASDALYTIYFSPAYNLREKMATFLDRAYNFHDREDTGQTPEQQFREIENYARVTLLPALDTAVLTYEQSLLDRMITLQMWQVAALLVILGTLLFECLFIFLPLARRLKAYTTALKTAALTDTLTSAGNARFFEMRGCEEIQRARRYVRPLSLMIIDPDHFNMINETFGREEGDRVIQQLTTTIEGMLRAEDVIARLNGELFGLLLPYADVRNAALVAERIRAVVEREKFVTLTGESIPLSASIGVTSVSLDADTLETALKDADQAMYEAKYLGRNRTVVNHVGQFIEVNSPFWDDFLRAGL